MQVRGHPNPAFDGHYYQSENCNGCDSALTRFEKVFTDEIKHSFF